MYNGKKVFLCILDGFAFGDENNPHNAVAKAKMPNLKAILKKYPNTEIQTSGNAVGLDEGQMGNSEVGHMTIGAGRILMQDLVKINLDIEHDKLREKEIIKNAISNLKNSGKSLHLIGLYSNGGVHSHQDHIDHIAKLFADNGILVNLHIITDGRDTPPKNFINGGFTDILSLVRENKRIRISTISGRYFAMDRDNKWDRVKLALDAVVFAKGEKFAEVKDLIESNKQSNKNGDEFITPSIISDYQGAKEGDMFLIANFRADRVRQLAAALTGDFVLYEKPLSFDLICQTKYYDNIKAKVLYQKDEVLDGLCEVFAKNELKQLKVAESEKYAHITFFINGGREELFEGEERILIPSPDVKTYDEKPEMSIMKLKETLVEKIKINEFNLIIANIANGDMVGHTGNFDACVLAAKSIDDVVCELERVATENNYIMIITADHGNIEEMIDKNGQIHTQHTTGPVPIIFCGKEFDGKKIDFLENASLANIAPTILKICNLKSNSKLEDPLF